jgi:hypothetical protein
MSEFGRSGGRAPQDKASTSEHFKEMAEDVRHDREAHRVAKARRRRPWWKVWAKRSG